MIPPKYWSPTKKLMLLGAMAGGKLVEDTATGNPLVFQTDLARLLKSLLIPFTPRQEGSGDPSPQNIRSIIPWNGLKVFGGGKNLIDDSKKYTPGASMCYIGQLDANYHMFLKAGQYTISCEYEDGEHYGMYYQESEDSSDTRIWAPSATTTEATFTLSKDGIYKFFAYRSISGGGVDSSKIRNVMLEVGQTASAYEEYRPITEIDIVFPAMGKNLLNPAILEQGGVDSDGSLFNSVRRVRTGLIPVEAGKKYVCTANTGMKRFMHFYSESNVSIGSNQGNSAVAPTGSAYVRCIFGYENEDSLVPADVTQAQLEQNDSSSSPYEPFTNAVYGGGLEVVSGKLMDSFKSVDLGNKSWSLRSENTSRQVWETFCDDATFSGTQQTGFSANAYCSEFAITTSNGLWTPGKFAPAKEGTRNVFIFVVPAGSYANAAECKEAMDGIELCYELIDSAKQEIQLTQQQITALLGNNTIWSDANGQMTAVYLKKGWQP